ncbi:telomeric repeat-binding factor 1 isoform X2 [Trematomus bernacchii]|uniref:telomeric repeat-binding factor 1 isoform X2 n=1 Tax=Trematomus bernacchii TaxID=40690 RepID=UPI00146ADE9B|nr:telomeric repeat-binding factor 1 isoform X2 [Trematomus bernacchii]
MAAENHNRALSEFSRVRAVTTGWIVDFMFLSLCRRFKEGKFEEFNEIIQTLEAITECPAKELHEDKTMICAFLARVMHGKQLDVQFEDNEDMLPLMSAAKIWSAIKHTVADQRLFRDILELLFVQSVTVCLISDQTSHACLALKWFEKNYTLPQNLCSKVSSMVTKKDLRNPLLNSYSFTRLLETVKTYLDAYLEKNPSDYLVKEATKMLQASPGSEKSEDDLTPDDLTPGDLTPGDLTQDDLTQDDVTQDDATQGDATQGDATQGDATQGDATQGDATQGDATQDDATQDDATQDDATQDENIQTTKNRKTKRRLLATNFMEDWEIDSCRKPFLSIKRIPENDVSQVTCQKSMETSTILKKRKSPRKWTDKLDHHLKRGVKRHGVGKWAQMLLDLDLNFEGRTGVMLKDRWRTLVKYHPD